MSKSKAYADTNISVAKSQADIAGILRANGGKSVSWDWEGSSTTLRFVWKVGGADLRARFTLKAELKVGTRIRKARGKSYTESRNLRVEKESMRLHRVLHWYLKIIFEAEQAGLLRSDEALLGWVEDVSGETVAECILPRIALLATTELRALPAGK